MNPKLPYGITPVRLVDREELRREYPEYAGEPDCSDCVTMTHCEVHHKTPGTYPSGSTSAKRDPSSGA